MVVRERPATNSKRAKVRICLDPFQTINRAIIRPVYPIPTLEENIHRFYKAKLFSTFDIWDAFQTIKLTEESSMLTTMHIPWGTLPMDTSPIWSQLSPRGDLATSPRCYSWYGGGTEYCRWHYCYWPGRFYWPGSSRPCQHGPRTVQAFDVSQPEA